MIFMGHLGVQSGSGAGLHFLNRGVRFECGLIETLIKSHVHGDEGVLSNVVWKSYSGGAPQPLRELPVRPERMIHFFPPHIDKIRAKIPETAKQVDVLCGNLEDAIPVDAKEAARTDFIEVAKRLISATPRSGRWELMTIGLL